MFLCLLVAVAVTPAAPVVLSEAEFRVFFCSSFACACNLKTWNLKAWCCEHGADASWYVGSSSEMAPPEAAPPRASGTFAASPVAVNWALCKTGPANRWNAASAELWRPSARLSQAFCVNTLHRATAALPPFSASRAGPLPAAIAPRPARPLCGQLRVPNMVDKINVEHLGRQHLQVRRVAGGQCSASASAATSSQIVGLPQISASTVLPIAPELAFTLITHPENEKVGVRRSPPPARGDAPAAGPLSALVRPRSSATWSAAPTMRCWSGMTGRGGWWWKASTWPPGASSRSAGGCAPGCEWSRTAALWCASSSWCRAGGCRQHTGLHNGCRAMSGALGWPPSTLASAHPAPPVPPPQVQHPSDLCRPVGGAGAAADGGRRAVLPSVVGTGGL